MERVGSILSLLKKAGASAGLLRQKTHCYRKFNSITCGSSIHSRHTNSKSQDNLLWVIIKNESRREGKLIVDEDSTFPWEKERHHEPNNADFKHTIKINLDHNHNDNNYLSVDWKTNEHNSLWKLSMMWDSDEMREE